MTICFTLCSNNYLAQAKTLGDSYLEFHPDSKFIIGLVDRLDKDFDYSVLKNFEVIPAETLQIPNFDELVNKYNIMELNTAVKPSYFRYLFETYKAEKVIFLDPDILVTRYFAEVIDALNTKNIVLTPQILYPVDDGFTLNDYQLLRDGIFNLGFIGLSDYPSVNDFLNFWHERLMKYGFGNSKSGMFYDQLWVNYVPALFDNYAIIKHPGYNMANWNMHERHLSKDENHKFFVHDKNPLCFFHFSGYKINNPEVISSYSNRYDFITRPDVKELFQLYRSQLLANNVEEIRKLPVYYFPPVAALTILQKIISRIKRAFNVLILGYDR